MKEKLDENNELNTNQLYIIINDYINNNIEFSNDKNKNLNQLKRLGRFLNEYQDKFNFEMCKFIISSSNELSAILKDIIANNMDDIKLNSNNIIYLLTYTYCTINNISIDNNVENFDDVELVDFIDNDAQVYIKEVGKIPLLSPDEEKRLLIQIANGDKKAREKFLKANLRLVISVANKCVGRGIDFEDLIQEGNIGLMKALDKFDVNRGFKFSTYAVWWIRQAITRAIYSSSRIIKLPVYLNSDISKYRKTKAELSMRLQCEPSNAKIAEEMGISKEYAEKLYNYQFDTVSINSKIVDDEDTELENLIADDNEPLEELMVDKMELEFLKEMFDILTKREAIVLNLRFGLKDGIIRTLEEVGTILNITRERVRQLEAKALRKLKRQLEEKERQEKAFNQEQIQNQLYMDHQRKTSIGNKVSINSENFANFQKIYNKINTDSLPKK